VGKFRLATTTLLLLLIPTTALHASSLSDALRAFVLGADTPAEARILDPSHHDSTTEACMGCHDASHTRPIAIRHAGDPLQTRGYRTINHPMEMRYTSYALDQPRKYRSPATLPATLRLPNGRVTCLTCHRLRAEDAATNETANVASTCLADPALTVGPRETDLCLACHLM